MFDNMYDRIFGHVRKCAASGERYKKKYRPQYDEKGHWELVPDGEENIYLLIQADKMSTDINVIMARYTSGETDVLSRIQGVYGDFTNMPKNYAEMLNNVIAGENLFRGLAPEIKEKFNNNFAEFMAAAGSDEWFSKIGAVRPEMKELNEVTSDA